MCEERTLSLHLTRACLCTPLDNPSKPQVVVSMECGKLPHSHATICTLTDQDQVWSSESKAREWLSSKNHETAGEMTARNPRGPVDWLERNKQVTSSFKSVLVYAHCRMKWQDGLLHFRYMLLFNAPLCKQKASMVATAFIPGVLVL